MKIKCFLIMLFAVLAAAGLLLVIAVSDVVSPVYGVVLEMIILAGYLAVCALVADKLSERREQDEEDVEI